MVTLFGKISSWCIPALIVLITVDVIFRYLFNVTYIWMMELEKYLFAFIILMSGGIALKENKHVRIDVLYSKISQKWKDNLDAIGILFFLIPWCAIVIYFSFTYFNNSLAILEKSSQPGGLPYLFIFKSFIPIGFLLLLIQGIVQLRKKVFK